MNLVRMFAMAGLVLAAATAQAGTIHPALEAKLAQTPPEEPVSVIVSMRDQAPVAALNQQLAFAKASPVERHRTILGALQSVTGTQDALKADLVNSVRGGSVLGYTGYWISNLMVVYALPAEIRRIAARPDVDVVELNFKAELIAPVNPEFPVSPENREEGARGIGVTPGLRAIRAPEVWHQLGFNGTGRLIGSLDTGVDGTHPALDTRWRCYGGAHPWQYGWLDLLGTYTTSPNDGYGHGTHTTGTVTGLGAATQDTIGVAWGAKWIACNAINQAPGTGFDQDIFAALQWFADPDGNINTIDDVPDVVNNSWGVGPGFISNPPYTDCDTRWYSVLDNCEAAGVVLCWSAGNMGPTPGSLGSPGDRATTLTNAFAVGAVSARAGESFPYVAASFSSRGPSGCAWAPPANRIKPEVCAPGVGVYSSVPGGYMLADGTSMASPHVAGIVALMRQANPGLSVDEVKTLLMQTARDEGYAGEDNTYGWGFIDAQAAVLAALVGFGAIEGTVTNQSWSGAPLAGARVRLVESGVQFTTDGLGVYGGSAVSGTYQAEASLDGFAPQTFTITAISNQTTVQNFQLTDIAGPVVTIVNQPVATIDTVGPYPISAAITDASTVSSATLYYRSDFGAWILATMALDGGIYQTHIPGQPEGTRIDYYVEATDGLGHVAVSPAGAPGNAHTLYISQGWYAFDVEAPEAGWLLGMPGDAATSGIWIQADPIGTTYNGPTGPVVQCEDDHTPDPGVQCFVTGNGTPGGTAGDQDVDNGCTTLRSRIFDLSQPQRAFLSYWRWFGENGVSADDEFAVDVSNDGGATWVPLERVPDNQPAWNNVKVDLGSLLPLTDQMCVRFVACDLGSAGLIDAAIDDISIETFTGVVSSAANPIPAALDLQQNQPNPFRPGANLTTIRFALSNPGDAKLAIFDASGRLVRTLFNGPMQSGARALVWNGLDDNGKEVGAGVYFYRLTSGAFEQSRRMTIVK